MPTREDARRGAERDDEGPPDGGTSRRRFLALAGGTLAGAAGATNRMPVGSATRQDDPEEPRVGLETVSEGFAAPVDLAAAPGERDRRFVVDRPGQVHAIGPDGRREEPFLDVADRLVDLGGQSPGRFHERGLLGLAFHPRFPDDPRLFVHYSAPPREGTPDGYDHVAVVSEFRTTEDRSRAVPDSERVLLAVPSPGANHNGGGLAFGPDGLLYAGLGDGGGGDHDDTGPGHADDWYERNGGGNGQDVTENLLGSVLRVDVDGQQDGKPYAIPDDNPLVGRAGLDEQYAWGFRNPSHLSFDGGGRLFAVDAGWTHREEVNLVERGGNYGWNVRDGTRCFGTTADRTPNGCPEHTPADVRGGEPLLDPIVEQPGTGGSVLVGGHVYERDDVERLRGAYVFGDWSAAGTASAGRLLAAKPPAADETPTPTETPTGTPTATPPETSTYELDATTDGWQGQAPSVIEAELNPTLTLVPGRTYEVVWQNLDGEPHNFQVLDGEENTLVSSSVVSGKGMQQTVEFEATAEMVEYRCKIHPTTMGGEVELAGGAAAGSAGAAHAFSGAGRSQGAPHGDREQWTVEPLEVESTGDEQVDGYVLGVGRGADGTLYVLTADDAGPTGDSGAVHRLVPPGEVEDGEGVQ